MSIYFVSFGNEMYTNSRIRIKNEVESLNLIDNIKIYTEHDLFNIPEFWDKHKTFILSNKRGYGYWIWKSYLTLKTMTEMNDNDILIYADAGCEISLQLKDYMKHIIEIAKTTESGIVSIELNCIEKMFTKEDLFKYLDCDNLKNTNQLHATFFFIRKCEHTMNIIKEWYRISSIYSLIDDTPSILPNSNIFYEHRHDQSIFSLLRKKYGTHIIFEGGYIPILDSRIRN
jgi:hypothetical protein